MPIPLACPSCKTTMKAPDAAKGRKVKCPKCSTVFLSPAASSGPPSALRTSSPKAQVLAASDPSGLDDSPAVDELEEVQTPITATAAPSSTCLSQMEWFTGASLTVALTALLTLTVPLAGQFISLPLAGIALCLAAMVGLLAFKRKGGWAWPSVAFAPALMVFAISAFLVARSWWALAQFSADLQKLQNNPLLKTRY